MEDLYTGVDLSYVILEAIPSPSFGRLAPKSGLKQAFLPGDFNLIYSAVGVLLFIVYSREYDHPESS